MKLFLTAFLLIIGFANFADDTLVVFDGGDKKDGKTWVHPRGSAKMEVAYQKAFSNKAHLSFDVRLNGGWAGAGWNWCSWKGKGDDISSYKFLVFRIGISKEKIQDLYIRLTSNDGTGQDAKGPKVHILPMIEERNKYVKIKILLEKLTGDKLNSKDVWGIDFEVHGNKAEGDIKIFIDQIEFTK